MVWEISLDMLSDDNSSVNSPESIQLGEEIPSHRHSVSPITSTICSSLVIDDTARHAFSYFRFQACTNFRIAGYPSLWAERAIAAGSNEPSIFYAVAATGMAERALTKTNILHTSIIRPIDSAEHKAALQMYSKALSYLHQPLQRAISDRGPLEPVILCCAVLLVFEARLGAHLDAMRHIRMGHRILNERIDQCNNISQQQLKSPSLTPQSNESWPSAVAKNPDHESKATPAPLPFTSLEASLEALTEASQNIHTELHYLGQERVRKMTTGASDANRFCLEHLFSRIIDISTTLQSRLNDLLKGLLKWGRNFRCLLASVQGVSEELLFVQIRYFYTSFRLAVSRGLDERLTDCFVDEIVRTLDNAERLLLHPSRSRMPRKATVIGPVADDLVKRLGATNEKPSTSTNLDDGMSTTGSIGPPTATESMRAPCAGIFEFGILPALSLIACKCRTSSHRWRALRLLQQVPRVEGVNTSSTLSAYAEAVVKLEEQRAAQLNGSLAFATEIYADEIPAEARFLDVVACETPEAKDVFTLCCTRITCEQSKQVELLEYRCNHNTHECWLVRTQAIALGDI